MSSTSDDHGQRRTRRVRCSIQVVWRRSPAQDDLRAECIESNAHGLFLVGVDGADVGDVLELVLELPDGAITAAATVRFAGVRYGARGIGLELAPLPAAKRARWLDYYRFILAVVETAKGEDEA
jgi:hypothetical protein